MAATRHQSDAATIAAGTYSLMYCAVRCAVTWLKLKPSSGQHSRCRPLRQQNHRMSTRHCTYSQNSVTIGMATKPQPPPQLRSGPGKPSTPVNNNALAS